MFTQKSEQKQQKIGEEDVTASLIGGQTSALTNREESKKETETCYKPKQTSEKTPEKTPAAYFMMERISIVGFFFHFLSFNCLRKVTISMTFSTQTINDLQVSTKIAFNPQEKKRQPKKKNNQSINQFKFSLFFFSTGIDPPFPVIVV